MPRSPLLFLALLACTPSSSSAVPTLGEVVGRVDVPRLLECAAMSGGARAKCLGASILTSALDLAVDKAADLAEAARDALNPEAGAEVSDADRAKIAADLDAALEQVAREAAKADG
jgi:hypothetical protein